MDHNKLENSSRDGNQITLPVSWEIYMPVKEQQFEPDMKQWTDPKLGKDGYGYLVYLTYMKSTLCEMPGWRKHKLQSR